MVQQELAQQSTAPIREQLQAQMREVADRRIDAATSTGALGLDLRSFDRLMYTPDHAIAGAAELSELVNGVHGLRELLPHPEVGRTMVRALVTQEALVNMSSTSPDACSTLEVAVAVPAHLGESQLYYVVFGQNGEQRQTPITPSEIPAKTAEVLAKDTIHSVTRTERAIASKYSYHHMVDADVRNDEGQTLEQQLEYWWGIRFGWQTGDVAAMQQRLEAERELPREAKNEWLSAITDNNGNLVAAAKAEALDLPIGNGESVRLVELTEFLSLVPRNESMEAAIIHLIAQVEHDCGNRNPVIFAECNTVNGAPINARKSGLTIPRPLDEEITGREDFPLQTLFGNVKVDDGRRELPTLYRSFLWMYLPFNEERRKQMYSRSAVQTVLELTGTN